MVYSYFYRRKFFRTKPIEILNEKKSQEFEIYTVAFNNVQVIDYQIQLCKKNITDDFLHIIVDNSSDLKIADQIRNVCVKYWIMYVKLPKNTLFCSQSHALALNYTRKNFIQKRACKYFWFLDHDIFPVKKTSLLPIIKKQKLYGYLVDKYRRWFVANTWFLWPGFSFFSKKLSKKFDFGLAKSLFPLYVLDSWWANYGLIYKYLNKNDIEFADRKLFGVDHAMKTGLLNYDVILDGRPPLKNIYYTYEEIKNWEWIHKWSTYFFWDKKSKAYKEYLSIIELFFINLEKKLDEK